MNKRQFLAAAAMGAAALPSFARARPTAKSAGPAILTVTGAIARANRGPLDSALDQMMHKQKIQFDKGFTFDFEALLALTPLAIQPTLEYDSRPHHLSGPALLDVIKTTGAPLSDSTRLLLRAVDGYVVTITVADAQKYRFIVATHLDGRPMPLGGLGPLWAVYDADRHPHMRAKPVNARFALCPWALYHIEVQGALVSSS